MCPECRLQHRLNFRNERILYKRKSSLSGKPIISIYHDQHRYPVYAVDEWWGDKWDALDYGQDFDFRRSFFEQFQELLLKVPRIALFNVNPENSDYCQQAYNNRNCYLCTVVKDSEDSQYLTHTNKAKDSYDCSHTQNIQLSYECLDSDKLYECIECQGCQNSHNLSYCYDCIGCSDSLGCSGLRNKKYHIFNKPYSKEEYTQKITSLELRKYSNYQKYKNHFKNIAMKAIHRPDWNLNTDECIGNYLINSKNSYQCFDAFEIQDCAYSTWIFESRDCSDIYGMGTSNYVYSSVGVENLNNCAFCTFVSDSNDVMYSDLCFYSSDLFGCVSLRKKKHCILNKQYSPEEYVALKAKIIEHMKKTAEWGKFFPVSLSSYAYNETVAQEYFPLSEQEILAQGFLWRNENMKEYQPASILIPDDILEAKDDILSGILSCETCKKNYKITSPELKFYRNLQIPIPHKCPYCRYMDRFHLRNPRGLHERTCGKCEKRILTTYGMERSERVYCESCYLQEIN